MQQTMTQCLATSRLLRAAARSYLSLQYSIMPPRCALLMAASSGVMLFPAPLAGNDRGFHLRMRCNGQPAPSPGPSSSVQDYFTITTPLHYVNAGKSITMRSCWGGGRSARTTTPFRALGKSERLGVKMGFSDKEGIIFRPKWAQVDETP